MAKLSFYVSDEVEAVIRLKAKLAELMSREYQLQTQWPEDYIALFDGWQDDPLERPSPLC